MGTYKENIPKADMLMGSMRSMGYSFESAMLFISQYFLHNSFGKQRRNSIANLLLDIRYGAFKYEIIGKTLQPGRFTNRQSSILMRMDKHAFSIVRYNHRRLAAYQSFIYPAVASFFIGIVPH